LKTKDSILEPTEQDKEFAKAFTDYLKQPFLFREVFEFNENEIIQNNEKQIK
jgi:hypothetical protein